MDRRNYLHHTDVFGVLQPTEDHPDGILNTRGYELASYLGAALICVSVLATSAGTHKHISTLRESRKSESLTLAGAAATAREILANKSFRNIMLFAVVISSSNGLTAALWIYLMTFFWLLNTDQIAFLSFMNLLGAAAAMMAFAFPGSLDGQAQHRIVRQLCRTRDRLSADTVAPKWLASGRVGVAATRLGNVCRPVFLGDAGLTDCVHVGGYCGRCAIEWGLRHEGAVVSAQTFVGKLSTAAGTWTAGLVLLLIAFPQTQAVDDVPDAIRHDLALVYVSIMLVSISLCALLLSRFTLNRAQHAKNLAALADDPVRDPLTKRLEE